MQSDELTLEQLEERIIEHVSEEGIMELYKHILLTGMISEDLVKEIYNKYNAHNEKNNPFLESK